MIFVISSFFTEAILMSTHNIVFSEEISKIISEIIKYTLYLFLEHMNWWMLIGLSQPQGNLIHPGPGPHYIDGYSISSSYQIDVIFVLVQIKTETSGPKVIKLVSCSTQLSMKFKLLINIITAKIKEIWRLKSS